MNIGWNEVFIGVFAFGYNLSNSDQVCVYRYGNPLMNKTCKGVRGYLGTGEFGQCLKTSAGCQSRPIQSSLSAKHNKKLARGPNLFEKTGQLPHHHSPLLVKNSVFEWVKPTSARQWAGAWNRVGRGGANIRLVNEEEDYATTTGRRLSTVWGAVKSSVARHTVLIQEHHKLAMFSLRPS